ncbi:MAG: hypothetical protein KatS3mg105_0644 [Gemmatales bacterium]|nr:MAG: hypothetical protein KatS3mg105_0644 [Gemmatales bacterium]
MAFDVGDLVVYRKHKFTSHPGPRAKHIAPAPHGDSYSYLVDKFWIVTELSENQKEMVLMTRTGKKHRVSVDDPNVRHANWWERLFLRHRFPKLPAAAQSDAASN